MLVGGGRGPLVNPWEKEWPGYNGESSSWVVGMVLGVVRLQRP